ncbi:Flp pilus assembly protein CpaB [bacterium]|nr:Flp pilus assembly protein CpaB [bacterium]
MIFRMRVIMPVAVAASALATFGLYQAIRHQKAEAAQPKMAFRKVVVAGLLLPAGKKLDASDLRTGDWPETIVPAGCFSDASDLVDRVVRMEIQPGEAVLETKLAPTGSEGGFSSIIPPGMRALTVSVNTSSGVSGFILPDARVDVLVTVSAPARKEESSTKIILEDIKVLAVDQTFERKEDDPVIVQTVTLLVTPDDAEKLVLASTEGKLQLSLRNNSDRSSRSTAGVKLRELIAKSGTQTSAGSTPRRSSPKESVRPQVVEVIRSAKREEVTFESSGDRSTE